MKKIENYTFNQFDKTITLTKKFYEAASRLNTPEYKELMAIRRDNPSYKMEVREIAKAKNKKTYRNLTCENMKLFIEKSMESTRPLDERLAEYETVKALSKSQASPYAYIKAWFLTTYGEEYNKYNKTEEDTAT